LRKIFFHHSIDIFGESSSGKTHILQSLAQIMGVQLGIIQCNSETDRTSILGRLEIDANIEETQITNDLGEKNISAYPNQAFIVSVFFAAAFSDTIDFEVIQIILSDLLSNSTNQKENDGNNIFENICSEDKNLKE
jgi:midasin (ATPase involved in ribosome maturation)